VTRSWHSYDGEKAGKDADDARAHLCGHAVAIHEYHGSQMAMLVMRWRLMRWTENAKDGEAMDVARATLGQPAQAAQCDPIQASWSWSVRAVPAGISALSTRHATGEARRRPTPDGLNSASGNCPN
jgi:hypothetical protein